MRSSFFSAMKTATARNPMIAIQNAHAFGPSSTVARMKMKMKMTPRSLAVAMTKTMVASGHNSIHHRLSWSSSWPPWCCPPCHSISRMTLHDFFEKFFAKGHENGKVPGQICWLYPKISVLELLNSSGLTNVIIWRSNHRIVDVLRFWINPPIRRP